MLRISRHTMWKRVTVLGLVAAVAAILVLSAGVATAKGKPPKPPKPPQEEPQAPNPDTGIIYFSFTGTIWSMAWDGSNKQNLGLFPSDNGGVSELTHGGERWSLTVDTVEGTYPNDDQRWEIFAVTESGQSLQLTDASDVEIMGASETPYLPTPSTWSVMKSGRPRWFSDDTKVSYWARRWQDGTVVEGSGGLYEAEVDWDTSQSDTTPTQLPVALEPSPWPYGVYVYDWSPDDSRIVYQYGDDTRDGGIFVLEVVDGAQPVPIATGGGPDWSPLREDGTSRILFLQVLETSNGFDYLCSVNPDGTDETVMVSYLGKTKKESLFGATWSPNATHVAYNVRTNYGRLTMNVYRANVQGEYETNLTSDLVSGGQYAGLMMAWRAE